MLKHIKLLLISISLFFIAGCTQIVPLNYNPVPQTTVTVKTKKTLSVGPFSDSRTNATPSLIFLAPSVDPYGGVTYIPYYTNQALTDAISNGISTALSDAHYRIVPSNSNLTLTGELVSIDSNLAPGSLLSYNLQTTIRMNLRLINTRTNAILWNQLVTGTDTVDVGMSFSDAWVQTAFAGAMNDLITQMMISPSFLQALKH